MAQRVLVTGGAGFIGSHIVDAYVAAGLDVVVVDNLATGSRANMNPAARLYEVDIRDRAALEQRLRRPSARRSSATRRPRRASGSRWRTRPRRRDQRPRARSTSWRRAAGPGSAS